MSLLKNIESILYIENIKINFSLQISSNFQLNIYFRCFLLTTQWLVKKSEISSLNQLDVKPSCSTRLVRDFAGSVILDVDS